MRSMTGVFLTLFLSPLFSLSHSLCCDTETQYLQSVGSSERCCSKCKPGERLAGRCTASSPTRCVPCGDDHYSDRYNVERRCHICRDCSMIRLEYRTNCTATHNSECGCERGYLCKSDPCLDCENATGPRPTPEAYESTTTNEGSSSSMWSTHIAHAVCCSALLIFVILVSRNRNVLRWIWRPTKGFRVAKETATPNQCTEEEGKLPEQECIYHRWTETDG